jgi:hypothetical protein
MRPMREGASDVAGSSDEDPGWELSPRLLLFLVPGLGRFALRGRRSAWEGLQALRNLYLMYTVSIFLFGVVVVRATSVVETEPAGVWVAALLVVAVLCLAIADMVGRRPLDGRDLVSLAGSHRNRMFLRLALSDAIALFAFMVTFMVGQWWIYGLFLPFTLFGFGRNAPTTRHIAADQDRLRQAGCTLSLVRALRGEAPA